MISRDLKKRYPEDFSEWNKICLWSTLIVGTLRHELLGFFYLTCKCLYQRLPPIQSNGPLLTNIHCINNKIQLWGNCTTYNIKMEALTRTTFLALEQIQKRNNIKVLIQNVSCWDCRSRCSWYFSEWNKIYLWKTLIVRTFTEELWGFFCLICKFLDQRLPPFESNSLL